MTVSSRGLIDLGNGATLNPKYVDDELFGFDWTHPRLGAGEQCQALGWIHVRRNTGWTVVSLDPITLTPSLLCTICQQHGFVRDGKWVEA